MKVPETLGQPNERRCYGAVSGAPFLAWVPAPGAVAYVMDGSIVERADDTAYFVGVMLDDAAIHLTPEQISYRIPIAHDHQKPIAKGVDDLITAVALVHNFCNLKR